MDKTKAWIKAFRLRTLPLTICCIALGSSLAIYYKHFDLQTGIYALSTALFLQILSNLANDYGDFVKGTDNVDRIGPERALQSGLITIKEMRIALVLFSGFSLLSGLLLVFKAAKEITLNEGLFFIGLGILCIIAAVTYTIGKKAYGYYGLGDFMVFFFFGLVGVCGTFYLHTRVFSFEILLPAISLGLLSTAVLNMNNTRDIENDKAFGKNTIPVRIGLESSKKYQLFLISGALSISWLFLILFTETEYNWIYLLSVPVLFLTIRQMFRTTVLHDFDKFLKLTVLGTLIWTICFCVILIL